MSTLVPCTKKTPCQMMQMGLDGTDPKKGGIAKVFTSGGQSAAFQSTKRNGKTLFLRLCPWCGVDISDGVDWP